MRLMLRSTHAALLLIGGTAAIGAQDAARVVAGGGISVPGWMRKVDAQEEQADRS